MKNPAVLLYTSDFITGTIFMSNEEVGAYIRLLCMQHQKGHLKKEEMIQICKSEEIFNSVIIHFEQDENKLYYNKRMDIEKEKRTKYSESRANNRKKKEETKPIKNKKDMKNISKTYEKHMENENINNIINNNNYKYIYINNNLYKKIIGWLNYKQERKEIYKPTGLQSLLTQIDNKVEIYGEEKIISLIDECMANNYKGIIFDKLKNKPRKQEKPLPEWFDKDIDKEQINKEDEEYINNLLNEFK